MVLPEKVGLPLTLPVPALTLALPLTTGLVKLKKSVLGGQTRAYLARLTPTTGAAEPEASGLKESSPKGPRRAMRLRGCQTRHGIEAREAEARLTTDVGKSSAHQDFAVRLNRHRGNKTVRIGVEPVSQASDWVEARDSVSRLTTESGE